MGEDSFLRQVEWVIKDQRLKRLIGEVWRRLPPHDKSMIRERVLEISEYVDEDEDGVLGSAGDSDCVTSVPGKCAAEVAKDLHYTVSLGGAREIQGDLVSMCVIAHELAHVVLRHNELSVVVASLLGFEPDPIYTESDFEDLKEWHEDHANLQVWLWGFHDELAAFLEHFPEARRPRWYVEFD